MFMSHYATEVCKCPELGQQAMYKSYATKNPIENTTVAIRSFVPAKVDIDVKISGFATSYSYAKGIDGVAQSIATANSKSNDWMDEGKAVCTITKSGIPSTLLSVKSVSMLVNGEEFSKDYTDDGNNTFTLHKTAHTKWEQKNVSVKVVYSTPDGLEFEGTSNTLTRHITGLPYNVSFNKNTKGWDLTKASLSNEYLVLGNSTGKNSAKCKFYTSNDTKISLTISKADLHSTSSFTVPSLKLFLGGIENAKALAGHYKGNVLVWKIEYDITYTNERFVGNINDKNPSIEMTSGTTVAGPYIHINELSVQYDTVSKSVSELR